MNDHWQERVHYLHTYFGTSAIISTVEVTLTEVPAFPTGLPSTITLPATPNRDPYQGQLLNCFLAILPMREHPKGNTDRPNKLHSPGKSVNTGPTKHFCSMRSRILFNHQLHHTTQWQLPIPALIPFQSKEWVPAADFSNTKVSSGLTTEQGVEDIVHIQWQLESISLRFYFPLLMLQRSTKRLQVESFRTQITRALSYLSASQTHEKCCTLQNPWLDHGPAVLRVMLETQFIQSDSLSRQSAAEPHHNFTLHMTQPWTSKHLKTSKSPLKIALWITFVYFDRQHFHGHFFPDIGSMSPSHPVLRLLQADRRFWETNTNSRNWK